MKKNILLATTVLAAASFAASASAVEMDLYGQVNKGFAAINGKDVDGSSHTRVSVYDNNFSSTRFGLKGKQELSNGLTASALLEAEALTGSSRGDMVVNVDETANISGGSFDIRHARVGLAGSYGALFIGHTSSAADYVMEQDLAGAKDVLGSDYLAISPIADANATLGLDGTRGDLVRYDSPVFGGVQLRLSTESQGDSQVGIFYNGEFGGLALKGALGYQKLQAAENDEIYTGSISAKMADFAATVAYGQKQEADYSNLYAKLGYNIGKTELAVDYGNLSKNATTAGKKTNYYGVGAQYDLGHGVSASGYYKYFKSDVKSNIVGVNMRVKF